MTASVRERHARLLADSRSAEPRARLAQAVSRADFLLRASRAVTAVQDPRHSLETLVALLLDDLVDVAQVLVRSGIQQLTAHGTHGVLPHSAVSRIVDGAPATVETVLRDGVAKDVVLPTSGCARHHGLTSLFVDEDLARTADELGVEQLVALPLNARGRTFGLVVLGRAHGYGFSGSRGFLDDLAERLAVSLDANLLVAESRDIARILRRSLAPARPPAIPGLDVATYFRVAHESEDVGGDFIDLHGPHGDLTLLCGDVAGKGVEAAVHAKRIRSAVRTGALVDRRPGWILDLVNRVMLEEAEDFDEALATATCLRLRRAGDTVLVDVANAGHPALLLLRAGGAIEEVQAAGVALGLTDTGAYAETSVELLPGDLLLAYTDGVTEARGDHDFFGEERLCDLVATLPARPANAVVEAISRAVADHLGDRPHDDIAVIAVRNDPCSAASVPA